jgi:uncharacterized FAD-dependent dehydrogenase
VVGFGPCGIFAGLLAQMGFKPIILERGKEVRQRTKDTWGLWRKSVLNPESNVQFGEGGAGPSPTASSTARSRTRNHGRKVLHEFVKAGAPEEILYVSKPHIGTFRLTGMVENMREQIIALGGEVRFQQRVTDVLIEDGQLRRGARWRRAAFQHVILALGHSARDTFRMLHGRGVFMEAKPFSVGFRIEHPQSLIDARAWANTPATRNSAPPTTNWCTTPRTAARSTASACARAAPWSRRQRAAAWSPTA